MVVPKQIVAIRRVTYDTIPVIQMIYDSMGIEWSPGEEVAPDVLETLRDVINDYSQEDLCCGWGHRLENWQYNLYQEDGVTEW